MKRIVSFIITAAVMILSLAALPVSAASASNTEASNTLTAYTVVRGDSMWKIAVRYQTGLDEIISANPQIKDPSLIYPGDVIYIPSRDETQIGYEAKVVRLVNIEREKYGLSPLTENWELSRVARYKSQDMADRHYFSHTSPTYGSPFDMMKAFGITYRFAGENIAYGQRTPEEVVNAWMNSSGHRANILNSSFRQIGVGYVADGRYWTQMFIG